MQDAMRFRHWSHGRSLCGRGARRLGVEWPLSGVERKVNAAHFEMISFSPGVGRGMLGHDFHKLQTE